MLIIEWVHLSHSMCVRNMRSHHCPIMSSKLILKIWKKWNTSNKEGYNTSSDVIYLNIGYAFKGELAIICSPQTHDSRGLGSWVKSLGTYI